MNRFVKNIPNMITCLRMIAAVVLIFLEPLSLEFYIVYGVCGFTDVVDGFVARRFHLESKLGSILDSIADWLFLGAMAYKIVPICIDLLPLGNWIIVGAVAVFHLSAYVVCAIRFKKFSSLHTYANKLMSALIFLFPFTLIGKIELLYTLYVYIGGAFALYSAVEMLLIHCIAKRYDVRDKSIFLVRKNEKTPIPEIDA